MLVGCIVGIAVVVGIGVCSRGVSVGIAGVVVGHDLTKRGDSTVNSSSGESCVFKYHVLIPAMIITTMTETTVISTTAKPLGALSTGMFLY